ncbi:MAG: hypothetical protein KGJ43_00680 [Acidobacteriota bacterium]|nr:hypothetical protein [Acidobacteriota bacterium]
MSGPQSGQGTGGESLVERFGKHLLAVLVMLVAAWVVIKLVIGIVTALFVPILLIVAVVAIIWAIRVLT